MARLVPLRFRFVAAAVAVPVVLASSATLAQERAELRRPILEPHMPAVAAVVQPLVLAVQVAAVELELAAATREA